ALLAGQGLVQQVPEAPDVRPERRLRVDVGSLRSRQRLEPERLAPPGGGHRRHRRLSSGQAVLAPSGPSCISSCWAAGATAASRPDDDLMNFAPTRRPGGPGRFIPGAPGGPAPPPDTAWS